MYNEIDREEIFNYIVKEFEKREEVISVIQVGSGAVGYRDKYSDLDIAVIVDDNTNDEIYDKTYNSISSKYNIFDIDNLKERKLQVFLLDNYLEIDIGYYTLDTIYARRENFKVIFDKSNKVNDIMTNSWNEIKEKNKGTTQEVNMKDVISFIDSELWYNVIHSVVAFKRNNKYRCYYELQEIRNYVIDLISKRNNVESKKYRNINELDQKELNKIEGLFIYPKDYSELEQYLKQSLSIIFDEYKYWKEKENIPHKENIDFYIRFIEENR